jgi:hypothetical protein
MPVLKHLFFIFFPPSQLVIKGVSRPRILQKRGFILILFLRRGKAVSSQFLKRDLIMRTNFILIIFSFLCESSIAQSADSVPRKDTMHVRGTYFVGGAFHIRGQIVTGGPDSLRDNRLNPHLRLRGHYFLMNKVAIGTGLLYSDYFYSIRKDLPRPRYKFNYELYTRYYPIKYVFLESGIIYGGYCNKNFIDVPDRKLSGMLSLGFEVMIRKRVSVEFDFKWHYDICSYGCFERAPLMPMTGYLGVNYYFWK